MEPSLILLDEPVASLDPLHTRMVREVIDKIAGEGITVVTATHDADYAWSWADEILLLGEGRLLAFGSPAEVFSRKDLLCKANSSASHSAAAFSRTAKGRAPSGIPPHTQNFERTGTSY